MVSLSDAEQGQTSSDSQAEGATTSKNSELDLAWSAFERDLDNLLRTVPGKWVAYRGTQRICTGDNSSLVYEECRRLGFRADEVLIELVHPAVVEEPIVFLPSSPS